MVEPTVHVCACMFFFLCLTTFLVSLILSTTFKFMWKLDFYFFFFKEYQPNIFVFFACLFKSEKD